MSDRDSISITQMEEWLNRQLGTERVEVKKESQSSPYRIDAAIQVFPDNEEEIAQILQWANAHGIVVVPQGGGTKDAYGRRMDRADIILSLSRCSGVIQHSVEDLTVSVLPGTPLSELQETLARSGQFLPLESPCEKGVTVGGLVAANASGPRRALYGSVRDYLIATRVVYPDGRRIRTGAKVVKNVAGYDMNKLFIGSMGTLGVMTELTFKIRPLPQQAGYLVISAPEPERFVAFQEMLLDSQLEPCMFEYMNAAMITAVGFASDTPALALSFEDVESAVQYELQQVKSYCTRNDLPILYEGNGKLDTNNLVRRWLHSWPDSRLQTKDELAVSVKLLSNITDVQQMHQKAIAHGGDLGLPVLFSGGALTGISRALIRTDWQREMEVREWVKRMQADLQQLAGHVVIEFAPDSLKDSVSVWGEPRPDQAIMEGIKRQIDPNRILNPGRYVGGI